MKNPFSLTFGKEPISLINRSRQKNEILEGFQGDNPTNQICMITGVRGSGKTVLLSEIAKDFRQDGQWIVVDLTPERDLLQTFAAELCNRGDLVESFREAKINLSFLGLGVEIDGVAPITDMGVAVTRMLERIKKQGKKVLITIDEAVCNQTMREFISLFQIYIRQELPTFLLLGGLYENIYELQNEKTLTFLYGAPKVELQPLNIGSIAHKYQEIFKLDAGEAIAMAKETMGYPFAFQVLGYLCFKEERTWQQVEEEYSQYLEEYIYEKLWSELSSQDKRVLKAMATTEDNKICVIRDKINIPSNQFSVYRDRLLKKGVVVSTEYGRLDFCLPRFKEFVLSRIW